MPDSVDYLASLETATGEKLSHENSTELDTEDDPEYDVSICKTDHCIIHWAWS